jgi:glucose-6-phosphate 1-dehydrogenase
MNKGHVVSNVKGMGSLQIPSSSIIVIFGASGDLAHKELLPALFALYCMNFLPKKFAIIGFDRIEFDNESYRAEMRSAVEKVKSLDDVRWNNFTDNLFYVQGDFVEKPEKSFGNLSSLIKKIQNDKNISGNVLFHLAVSTLFYSKVIKELGESGLSKDENGWRRIIIEKPFGWDEKSAREIDKDIHKVFNEDQIFRVDHFLGKETVQNMLVFRFANPGYEPIWNRNYIESIQITVSEDIGIGTRAAFYEKIGVVRDMIQNHLFQLMCITAIEPPVNYNANSLRSETLQVLEAVCSIDKQSIVFGQYDSGKINNEDILSYRDEKGVNKNSTTPTFAALRIYLDNWRWAGVPFNLRTGKRLNKKLTEVRIKFKPTPHLMFPIDKEKEKEHNVLTFRIQPNEGIYYKFTAKKPGASLSLTPVDMNFEYATAFGIEEPPNAYQWLIYDALIGDQTLFPTAD